ncbi:MAG: SufS family cysteine desulfurase [Betaproteobacteria bacterium]|nr:SufS family cysteine desulfurase [Betaproteobacteria bacterium]
MSATALLHPRVTRAPYDLDRVRAEFPILANVHPHGKPLVYLDNAASCQMPQPVIDRLVRYQTHEHANIHRGVHYLSETATEAYEGARRSVQRFLNAREEREIVFTTGATEAINLVMHGYGRKFIGAGDEIIITYMEHHSNIVPWQMLCEEKGAVLKVAPIDDRGELVLDAFDALFTDRTRFVAVTHVSNALGTVTPLARLIETAHAHGVPILVDGAQAAPHLPVDVQALDCDFYCFSGHKLCGPTGSGALYGKAEMLEKMQPFKGGGDMILSVSFEKTTYNAIPHKFEAGTPPIAAMIGLGAALDYVSALGMERIAAHEHALLEYATSRLSGIEGIRIIGTAREKAAVLSFYVGDVHPHDVGTLLNEDGVAVRTGHHCAQPVMQRFGVPATARASFALYNTFEEVDALVNSVERVQRMFA